MKTSLYYVRGVSPTTLRCGTKANFTAGPRVSDADWVACYVWRDQAFVSTRTCWRYRKLDY